MRSWPVTLPSGNQKRFWREPERRAELFRNRQQNGNWRVHAQIYLEGGQVGGAMRARVVKKILEFIGIMRRVTE
jgi:hypothetical protein